MFLSLHESVFFLLVFRMETEGERERGKRKKGREKGRRRRSRRRKYKDTFSPFLLFPYRSAKKTKTKKTEQNIDILNPRSSHFHFDLQRKVEEAGLTSRDCPKHQSGPEERRFHLQRTTCESFLFIACRRREVVPEANSNK